MARVLLLNPPAGSRPVLRDYSCGETAKADYYWAPIDLLVLSGVLDGQHELCVIDAVVEGLSASAALRRAIDFAPDCVFSLVAAVSLDDDAAFLSRLKSSTGARIYVMGDVASFAPVETLQRTPVLDGLVRNFAEPSLSALAGGGTAEAGAVLLAGDTAQRAPEASSASSMTYGCPRHDLFPLPRYRLPFSKQRGSTTVLTSYGCPFPCTFCASRRLPRQHRDIDDVVAELRSIRQLGIRDVYIRDFTFGPSRSRAIELCRAIAAAKLGLKWSAECRTDVLDEDTIDLMARAGCDVILVGVESGDESVLERLGKRWQGDRTARILAAAHRRGIRTCGHFVLGTPGESEEQIQRTIRIAQSLPLDYASFNLYAPRLGTELRDQLVQLGRLLPSDFSRQDVSLEANAWAEVTPARLRALHRAAIFGFYFRPSHMLRLLGNTPWSTLARQGASVLRNTWAAAS